ncbi:MAG: hypothetical protein HY064_08145 [Bacteroidetes bacterium]|nr:hypothetical protein [Bacteroidota bacterium]
MNPRGNFPKYIFNFYLFGNFHIALCAVALTMVTQHLFGFQLRRELFIFIFCGTFFGYNLQRLPSAYEKHSINRKFFRHHWNTQHRILLTVLSAAAAVAFAWSYSRLLFRSQIIALIPAALSFAYAFPVIPGKRKWLRLRDIPGAKIFVITIVWLMSCALLPAAAAHVPHSAWFSVPILLWSLVIGLLIFSLTIPFDIRDNDYDGKKLSTIPAMIGVRNSIILALFTLFLSAGICWMIFFFFKTGDLLFAPAYTLWCMITSILIYKSSTSRHEYYFSFLIDGTMLLLGGMILLAGQL